jgi:membrane associated rhomboid family serine protease
MLPEIDFRRAPVTISLAMIIVALEIVSNIDPERRFYYYNDVRLGLLSPIWSGQVWRPFTTTLLHGNFIHAAFNLYWLWVFGHVLEPRFGSLRFLLVCVLLAYVSMLPEFLVTNYRAPVDAQVGVVGFSGVCYGLFGLLWIGRRWEPQFAEVCDDDTVRLMLGWFVLCIGMTWADLMPVANIAHGAGWLFGALYGMAAFSPHRRWRWTLAAALATLAVLSTLLGFPGHNGYEYVRRQRQFDQILKILRSPPPAPSPQPPAPSP